MKTLRLFLSLALLAASLRAQTFPTVDKTALVKDASGNINTGFAAKTGQVFDFSLGTVSFGAGGITWASVSKSGSSLADLATRSATDLNSGALAVTLGGTGVNSATLGDLNYGSGTNTRAVLAGNTAATKKFLTQTGNGSVSAAPAWGTIVDADLPSALTGKTYNGLTLTSTTGTFTLANAKTLTVSNTLTLAGTDSSTLNIGAGGTLGSAAFTASTAYVPAYSGLMTNGLLQANGASVVASTVTPSGLTSLGVNSVTAAASTSLVLSGGSSGSSITIGFGAAGRVGVLPGGASNPVRIDKGATAQNTNTAIGDEVLDSVINGTVSVTLPSGATVNASANYNTGLGFLALNSLTHGEDNTAVGANALSFTTNGFYNTAIGHYALGLTTTGDKNTGVGAFSLNNNVDGYGNTAFGFRALNNAISAFYNVAVGIDALYQSTSGNYNTAIGPFAMDLTTTGSSNTAAGRNALYDNTSGSGNTVLGAETARGLSTGSNNTILGAGVTGLAAGLASNVILATGDGMIRAQFDGSNWNLNASTAIVGALSTTGNWSSLVGGAATATIQSSVNGALVEFVMKGKNSTGTAREAHIGINKFADDVWSLHNGTTEYQRVSLTNGATSIFGTLTTTGSILVSVGGAASLTTLSSVNGALSEFVASGKNSTGAAREVRFGINKFADNVASIYTGSIEIAQFDLTTAAAKFTGSLTFSAYGTGGAVTVGAADSGGSGFKLLRVPN